jgi:hypothetical protein
MRLSRRWAVELRGTVAAAPVWALPLLVLWAVYLSPRHILSAQTAVGGLLALGLLLAAAKRPDRALLGLIIFLPFQGLILAKLFTLGAPASLVHHLGAWKETLAVGVVAAGAREFIASGRRADMLDRLALGFAAFVALYALLQPAIAPGAPSTTSIRLLGFREIAGFPLVLLGARHARLGADFPARATRVVSAVGAIVAAVGVFGAIDSGGWNTFIVRTVGYTRYQIAVLHTYPANPYDIRIYGMVGGARIARIGSVFLNPLTLAWYMILPFAIGFERIVRRTATPLTVLATVLVGAALLLTQTRSAFVAALVVALLAWKPAIGRRRHWRTRVAILLAGLTVIGLPGALASGFAKRLAATNTARDQSSAGHLSALTAGLSRVAHHPLGDGLGTSAGTGQRFEVANTVVPENNYLDIGVQLGFMGMSIFIALTLVLIVKLRWASRASPYPLLAAVWASMAGLAVAALVLQPWLDFSVTWTYWGLAGAMLGAARSWAAAREQAGARPRGDGGPWSAPQPAAASASL